MIAAIAVMTGYNLKDDNVQATIFLCLVGMTLADCLPTVGANVSKVLTRKAILSISGEMIGKINKAVGAKLLTRFGTKGVIKLGALVPIVGGIVGAAINAATMNAVGNRAKKEFLNAASS